MIKRKEIRTKKTYLTLNSIRIIFCNRQQSLRQKHLQFLHEEVLWIVYTDKRADDITRFVSSEF